MRRALLLTLAIAFALACGDDITEPTTAGTTPTGTTAIGAKPLFATTTTEDGLSISTDKDDYQPGDVVHFTGYGWQPGDVLDIVLTDEPATADPHVWSVEVGADGMFHDSTYVVDEGDLNVAFTLVATSRATGRSLTVNFTDSQPQSVALTPTTRTVAQGSPGSAAYNLAVTVNGNADQCTITLSVTTPLPTGATAAFSGGANPFTTNASFSRTLTITTTSGTPAGTTNFTVQAARGANCQGNGAETATGTLIVQAPADQTRPTVTINQATGQADPTNASPINFTVVFSETVTDFATGDVTLSGTAGATTATVTGSGTTYNVAVSGMTTNGTVIATIGVDKAHDAAGNGNDASTSTDNTVTYDNTGPTVTINQKAGQADPTNASPIDFTVVFSKPVTDFATGDVTLSGTAGATTAAVTGSGTTYNVAVSGMTTNGTVIASIAANVAHDAAGNGNMASSSTDNEVTYDHTSPDVTINQAVGQADPTNASPINFTVVFNEPVSDFATGDVTLSGTAGATTQLVTGSGTTYNVAISGMTSDGTVIASIAAAKASDAAGNLNTASTSTDHTVTYDHTPPDVTINQAAGQADPTSNSPINFTVVFTENVTGFESGDVTLSGTATHAAATVTGGPATYNVAVPVTGPGTVIASIGAEKASDAAGNGNTASTSTDHTVTYDPEPPVVSNVAVSPNPTNGSIEVSATATVDDQGTGGSIIVAAYYNIDGGATLYPMTADDHAFDQAVEDVTGTISLTTLAGLSPGSHTICVQGKDAAGNTSLFSATDACTTLTIDRAPPVVSDVQVSPTPTNGTIEVSATATVSDYTTGSSKIAAASFKIDGGVTLYPMTADDHTFDEVTEAVTGTISLSTLATLSEGPHTICVQGKDAAGNTSLFSTAGACTTLMIDKTPPEVTIEQKSGQADPTNGSTIEFTVNFTENVSDFATGDVSLSGTAGPTTAIVTGSGKTYDVAVSGMTVDGTVIASIAAGKAHDAAGNGNNASTSTDHTVVYDATPPVISCGTADGVWHAADVTIACTASDAPAGLANAGDASFNLSTNVPAGTETANAATGSRAVADNAGNSATAGPITGNKVDKKAPQVALTCPANLVILNASANANWTASDGGSGVTPSGSVALATNSIGSKTASVTVQDAVGNSNSSSCNYTVGYNFTGFSAPVDRPNTMNVSKAGQAIPLKWRLTDALGRPITDVTSVSVQAATMTCDQGTTQDQIEEYAAGASGLQNLGDGYYQFNWKTPGTYAGSCKTIALAFGAGALGYTEKPSAYFTFKK